MQLLNLSRPQLLHSAGIMAPTSFLNSWEMRVGATQIVGMLVQVSKYCILEKRASE